MKIKKYITKEVGIDIQGITLLSVEEYKAYNSHISPIDHTWWLRSPGFYSPETEASVTKYNRLDCYGHHVRYTHLAVRPILKLSGLTAGDKFTLFDHNWTGISDEYALCDDIIGCCPFREDSDADDANDYEASDVKKFLEGWFEKQREGKQWMT